MNLRQTITDLNVIRSYSCDPEKSSEIKNCILGLLSYAEAEEEIGIELTTLVKAITVGFYYKGTSSHNIPYIGKARGKHIDKNYFRINNRPYYFKDYGVTWALTKEELQ